MLFSGRDVRFPFTDNQVVRVETKEVQERERERGTNKCNDNSFFTSTQVVGISAGLSLILNLYQPGDSEWSQIRSWMAVFWISVESKSTLRWGLLKI